MAGFTNDINNLEILIADNVNFSGDGTATGKVTTDGQLLIGSTVTPHIRVGSLTAGSGVTVTNSSGNITISASGSVPLTFATDAGTAVPSGGIISIKGGTGINTSGAGSVVTINASSSSTLVKQVRVSTSANTALGVMPQNPAVAPANTDGTQVFTLAITPASSSNILVFEGVFCISIQDTSSLGSSNVGIALYQGAGANAIYANFSLVSFNTNTTGVNILTIPFMYSQTAGSTSSITFAVRAGYDSANYTGSGARLNWDYGNANHLQGGVGLCMLTITEFTS